MEVSPFFKRGRKFAVATRKGTISGNIIFYDEPERQKRMNQLTGIPARIPVHCIAHRGASSLAPENTLSAAQQAIALGADMWETDVTLTRDGFPIIFHDDTPERTTNIRQVLPHKARWPVHRLSLDELRHLDYGSWFLEQDPFGQVAAGMIPPEVQTGFRGATLLTLEEALDFTRAHHWRVNLELKDLGKSAWSDVLIGRVIRAIKKARMVDSVLISSFNPLYLERIRAVSRSVQTALLIETPVYNPADLLRRLGAQAYHPDARLINPELVADLRAHGFEVNIWTINNVEEMKSFIQAGVSGIITDFPQTLRQLLSSPKPENTAPAALPVAASAPVPA